MIADPEHDRIAELLGVFVLDAVDAAERQLVEAHLGTCSRCRAQVDGLREIAAGLAVSAGSGWEEPPSAVWDRIAAEVRGHEAPAGARTASPAPFTSRPARPRTTRRVRWVGGAVVGAAAAAVAALAIGLVHTQAQVHQLQSALAARGSQAAVRAALASPGHQVVDLESSRGVHLAEVVVQRDGAGLVVRSTMAELPASETYQLWASIDGRPISLGLLGRHPGPGASFSLGTSVLRARELMVTVEPAGGVPAPDRAPVGTAPLSVS